MRRLNERRAAELRDAPDDGQFAVSATFRREVRYGFDEGLIAFTDGWLIYSGRGCSFSVRKEDVLRVLTPDRYVSIEFLGPRHKHTVEFRGGDAKQLSVATTAWFSGADAEGVPIFPPVVAERLARLGIGFGGTLLTLVVALTLAAHLSSRLHGLSILVGFAAACSLAYGIGAQLALRRVTKKLPMKVSPLLGVTGIQFFFAEQSRVRSLKSQGPLQ